MMTGLSMPGTLTGADWCDATGATVSASAAASAKAPMPLKDCLMMPGCSCDWSCLRSENVVPERHRTGASEPVQSLRFAGRQHLREPVFAVSEVGQRQADAEAAKALRQHQVDRAAALFDDVRRVIGADVRDAVAEIV